MTCIGNADNSEWWSNNSSVNQTWNGSAWEPVRTGHYSESQCNNECCFKCREHYTWHGETCDADTQEDVICDKLPANASWWNEPHSITQTWNGNSWAPSNIGSYSSSALENECVFRCDNGFFWKNGACVTPCTADSCGGAAHAVCVAASYNTFNCECDNADEGYFWSGSACLNPCEDDPCSDILHSETHECVPLSPEKFTCVCDEGYFWDNYQCAPKVFGRICTGQNKCYDNSSEMSECPSQGDDFFGQDAQYAELGYCAPRSFREETVEGDLVLIDNNLGLEWQQTIEEEIYIWNDAVSYCAGLSYAGHDDWRLPTGKELFSFIDHISRYSDDMFWTSEERNDEAYRIALTNRNFTHMPKSNSAYVRCVRGNELMESELHSLTVSANGNAYEIITDSTTRLIWQKNSEGGRKTWKNALAYCESLNTENYAGLNNWRVPNFNELFSSGYGQESFFSEMIWSSSTLPTIREQAVTISNQDKDAVNKTKTGSQYVLCVHSDPCEEGKFWNGSKCVNPCDTDPCNGIQHSTGVCSDTNATSWNDYSCGCADGYGWNGTTCLPECSSTSGTPCYDSTSGLTWSAKSPTGMYWDSAVTYCKNNTEGGYTDWRLPDIDELRTLILECAAVQTGGECGVTTSCLSSDCWTRKDCQTCGPDSTGGHSKFGDTDYMWSSSIRSDNTEHEYAWSLFFNNANLGYIYKTRSYYVRCVRNAD